MDTLRPHRTHPYRAPRTRAKRWVGPIRRAILALGGAFALFTSPTDGQIHHSQQLDTTGVAGAVGQVTLDHDLPPAFGISGLETAESFDKPCRVGIMVKGLPGTENALVSRDYGNFGEQQINAQCIGDFNPVPSRQRVGFFGQNNRFVQAVQVCVRRTNGRVKGLRLFAARVFRDGRVEQLSSSGRQGFARKNCNDWVSPRATCPEGRFGTGVIAHFAEVGLVGLQLKCATLVNPQVDQIPENAPPTDASQAEPPAVGGGQPPKGSTPRGDLLEDRAVACAPGSCGQAGQPAPQNDQGDTPASSNPFNYAGNYTLTIHEDPLNPTRAAVRIVQRPDGQLTVLAQRASQYWGLIEEVQLTGTVGSDGSVTAVAGDGTVLNLTKYDGQLQGELRLPGSPVGSGAPVYLTRR